MSSIKEKIESCLLDGNMEEARCLIDQYEKEIPDDIDLVSMKMSYYLLSDDLETAADLALVGVRRMPFSGDMYYNLAYIYELMGRWLDAYLNYQKALFLYNYMNDEKSEELDLEEKADQILENFVEE
ncbi:MAG: hypothetical protein K2N24_10200, partial [Lachnospiraceae bacterium]|nr:hypothetical protein [Lachnospiraceae bacterium]